MNNVTLKWFCFAVIGWSICLAGFNYIVDPIQYYGPKEGQPFIKTMRYQIPGLIRSYDFDTIFVGTSHSANFNPNDLPTSVASKAVNLSVNASSGWEQRKIVDLSLSHNQLKYIIWELNYRTLTNDATQRVTTGIFPDYFYEKQLSAHFYYLFSLDTIWKSVKTLIGKGHDDINTINAWMSEHKDKFDGTHVKKHFCSRLPNAKISEYPSQEDYENAFDELLLPAIRKRPDTTFKFFIPPLSQYNYALPGEIEKFSRFRIEAYEKLSSLPNVELHDFSNNIEWITKPENYKDVEHYSYDISKEMLNFMAGDSFLVAESADATLVNKNLKRAIDSARQSNVLFPSCKGALK